VVDVCHLLGFSFVQRTEEQSTIAELTKYFNNNNLEKKYIMDYYEK